LALSALKNACASSQDVFPGVIPHQHGSSHPRLVFWALSISCLAFSGDKVGPGVLVNGLTVRLGSGVFVVGFVVKVRVGIFVAAERVMPGSIVSLVSVTRTSLCRTGAAVPAGGEQLLEPTTNDRKNSTSTHLEIFFIIA